MKHAAPSDDSHTDVVIAGGGLAGLSAAVHLHRAGVTATICEAADDIGGRVRTDRTDGFVLDRGFQVLLPAYPELHRLAAPWPSRLAARLACEDLPPGGGTRPHGR